MKKKYFLTYDEQISFLVREKGLHISDQNHAKALLLKTGYFSLINGYKEVFKQPETGKFRTELILRTYMSCIALMMICEAFF